MILYPRFDTFSREFSYHIDTFPRTLSNLLDIFAYARILSNRTRFGMRRQSITRLTLFPKINNFSILGSRIAEAKREQPEGEPALRTTRQSARFAILRSGVRSPLYSTIGRISEPFVVWGTVFVQTKRHSLSVYVGCMRYAELSAYRMHFFCVCSRYNG